jgi:hypothetical protein
VAAANPVARKQRGLSPILNPPGLINNGLMRCSAAFLQPGASVSSVLGLSVGIEPETPSAHGFRFGWLASELVLMAKLNERMLFTD